MIVTNPFSPGSLTRETINSISKNWWVLLLSGVVSIVAGGLIVFTDWTVDQFVTFVGLLFIFRGIFSALSFPVDASQRGWAVAAGLLQIGIGIAVFTWPSPTLLALGLTVGWWVMFSGVMTTAGAIAGRDFLPYWGLILAYGIVETVFSLYLVSRPDVTIFATVMAIGLWAMVTGFMQAVLSFEVKNLPRRFDTAVRNFTAKAAAA